MAIFKCTIEKNSVKKFSHIKTKWIKISSIDKYKFNELEKKLLSDKDVFDKENFKKNSQISDRKIIDWLIKNQFFTPLIFTVTTGILMVWLKAIWYTSEYAKIKYWNLDSSALEKMEEHFIYFAIPAAIFVLAYFLISFPLVFIWRLEIKMIKKLMFCAIWVLFVTLILAFVFFYFTKINFLVIIGFLLNWKSIIIIVILLTIPTMPIVLLQDAIADIRQQNAFRNTILAAIPFIIIFILSIPFTYNKAYQDEKSNSEFRMLSNGYAIVYENKDFLYLVKFELSSGGYIKDKSN